MDGSLYKESDALQERSVSRVAELFAAQFAELMFDGCSEDEEWQGRE